MFERITGDVLEANKIRALPGVLNVVAPVYIFGVTAEKGFLRCP